MTKQKQVRVQIDPNHKRCLDQSWQQLMALENSLRELRNSESISNEQYKIRSSDLKHQKHRLRMMKSQLIEEKTLITQSKYLGFPELEEVSNLELSAVENYLDGRFYTARDMYNNVVRLSPWVEEAAQGKARFKAIFRLSRIKSYLNKVKEENNKVKLDIDLQKKLLTRMTQIILGSKFKPYRPIIEMASEAFNSSNRLKIKISELEKAISLKKQEIHYMKNWLKEARTNIRRKIPEPPPELGTLKTLSREFDTYGIDQVNRSKERLTLASVYVQTYVKRFAKWDQAGKRGF